MKPKTKLIPITDRGSLCPCSSKSGFSDVWWWEPSGIKDLTPSGIITAKAVPTRSPAPNTVIFFNLSYNRNIWYITTCT